MATRKQEEAKCEGRCAIVIGQRGWVWVGRLYLIDAEHAVIEKAKNVRRWGTSSGLGELAARGPQPNTKLDEAGTVRLHPLSIVASYDANPEKWDAALNG